MKRQMQTILMILWAVILFAPSCVNASLLVWDGTQWPQATLSQDYLVDGVAIEMDFTGNVSRMLNSSPYYLPKDDLSSYTWGSNVQGLWYGVTSLPDSEFIDLTIKFGSPVTGLTFNYYDLDGSYEQLAVTGNLFGALHYPAISTLASPSAYTYPAPGTVRSNGNSGDPGAASNTVTFDFGTNTVDEVLITFTTSGNNAGLLLGNLSFDPVPEPMTLGILGLGGLFLRKRQ